MKIKNLRGKYECRKKLCSQHDILDAFRSTIGIGGEDSLIRFAIFWELNVKKNKQEGLPTSDDTIRRYVFRRLANNSRSLYAEEK